MIMQGDPLRVRRTAGFAKIVAATAEAGDTVAHGIIESAAEELAVSVVHAARRRMATRRSVAGQLDGQGDHHQPAAAGTFPRPGGHRAAGITTADPYGIPLDGVSLLLDLPGDNPITRLVAGAGR